MSTAETCTHFPEDLVGARRGALESLQQTFRRLQYDESSICAILGLADVHEANADQVLVWAWARTALRERCPLATLVRVFLLGFCASDAELRRCFSAAELRLLADARLLDRVSKGALHSPIALYPLGPHVIATDRLSGGPVEASAAKVMYLGADSYGLTRLIAPRGGRAALDLCTGSGAVAISMAARFEKVIGVDVNPRAVSFARFNAAFNGVRNCEFRQGDLYGAVAGEELDVVTANPPFVPSPDVDILFRDGGRSGEDVLSRIIAGCARVLRPSGVLAIVTDAVDHTGLDYEQKVRRWLGERQGFVGAVLPSWKTLTPLDYAGSHVGCVGGDDDPGELGRWMDVYRAEGICAVTPETFIVLQRMGDDPTEIARAPRASLPRAASWDRVDGLLRAVATSPARAAEAAAFRVSARIGASVSIEPAAIVPELAVPLALALGPRSAADVKIITTPPGASPRETREQAKVLLDALHALHAFGHAEAECEVASAPR